jgi:hypothetical protein
MAKFIPFEKSGKDKEVKGKGKEGSKKEEAFDFKQKRFSGGGLMRGGGAATKGKKFAGTF